MYTLSLKQEPANPFLVAAQTAVWLWQNVANNYDANGDRIIAKASKSLTRKNWNCSANMAVKEWQKALETANNKIVYNCIANYSRIKAKNVKGNYIKVSRVWYLFNRPCI